MSTPIRIKRSAVSGKRPQLTDLQLGELALNTNDGSLFTERDTGGVGIATTVSNLTPWTESYGASSISYLNSVGIGTNNPQFKLDVNGSVNATAFIGDGGYITGISTTNIIDYGVGLGGASIAGVNTTGTSFFNHLNISGISTFAGEIDANGRIVGAAVSNVIPFLYNNYSDLPSAVTYHGAFAHVHATQKAYFAHGGAWYQLVNQEVNGVVGTGTEVYDIGNFKAKDTFISGVATVSGAVIASVFGGSGYSLTNLNASNIGFGTIPDARFPTTLPAISGASLTDLTGASAGTYGNSTAVPQIVIDANGRITGITNVSVAGGGGGGGSSIIIKDSGSLVGTAGTIDYSLCCSLTSYQSQNLSPVRDNF